MTNHVSGNVSTNKILDSLRGVKVECEVKRLSRFDVICVPTSCRNVDSFCIYVSRDDNSVLCLCELLSSVTQDSYSSLKEACDVLNHNDKNNHYFLGAGKVYVSNKNVNAPETDAGIIATRFFKGISKIAENEFCVLRRVVS